MRRSLCLFAALFVVAIPSNRATAQARQEGASRNARDTLPERVVQRAFDAYSRKDLNATFANWDTVFTHEYLGDPAGAKRVRRVDWVRQFEDTAVMRNFRTQHVEVVRQDVFGPFVNAIWVSRTPDGKQVTHLDLFEVRHGKIVREIES